ncbi:MAG: adenylyltransferase/cytidyltransferase family protein [Clostridiales bacterium]|nr:adenylyltransferase/cytidyltransferase family protein [Clostridiales bacterium]
MYTIRALNFDMKTGLTIGKYAPLHKGHQHIIEKALEEMDELIVIVYDAPKYTNIPLEVRAGWIRKLYPGIRVIEAKDVPNDVGYTEEIQQKHEKYILKLIEGVKISAFYSSEAYGERMSKALGAINRLVDIDRKNISISGTAIRHDPYGCRDFIEPIVFLDLIRYDYHKIGG